VSAPRILIAGGGIGGLAAALALTRAGFRVEVHEQAQAMREVGAGVQLSANATRALAWLGVLDDLRGTAVEAQGKEIRLWSTGQTWTLFDLGAESIARYGYPYLTAYRPDLLAALERGLRAADPHALRLGARAEGFVQDDTGVTLYLAGGSTARGNALIGADGIHSRIRAGLFGADRPRFTGLIAWRGVVPMARLPQPLHRMVGTNWVGPGRHVVHYPLRAGTLMNVVGIVERGDWQVESWSTQGDPQELLRDFSGWHDDVQTLMRNVEKPFKWALATREPLMTWSRGCVSLLGDACHPTLPMLAQGAAQAIEDGVVLARALAQQADIPAGLRTYEAARVERTARMVRGSAENATRFHNPALAHAEGAADYVSREWAEERIRERYEWLFTYRADEVRL